MADVLWLAQTHHCDGCLYSVRQNRAVRSMDVSLEFVSLTYTALGV